MSESGKLFSNSSEESSGDDGAGKPQPFQQSDSESSSDEEHCTGKQHPKSKHLQYFPELAKQQSAEVKTGVKPIRTSVSSLSSIGSMVQSGSLKKIQQLRGGDSIEDYGVTASSSKSGGRLQYFIELNRREPRGKPDITKTRSYQSTEKSGDDEKKEEESFQKPEDAQSHEASASQEQQTETDPKTKDEESDKLTSLPHQVSERQPVQSKPMLKQQQRSMSLGFKKTPKKPFPLLGSLGSSFSTSTSSQGETKDSLEEGTSPMKDTKQYGFFAKDVLCWFSPGLVGIEKALEDEPQVDYPNLFLDVVDMAVVQNSSDLIVIGGRHKDRANSEVFRLNLVKRDSARWKEAVSLFNGRFGHAAAACSGSIYIFGGWLKGYGMMNDSEVISYRDLKRRSRTSSKTWDTYVDMTQARCYHSVVVHRTSFYILGGYVGFPSDLPKHSPITNSVESKSLFGKEWKTLAPMLTPRARFTAAVYKKHIYAVGGYNRTNSDEFRVVDTFEDYSINRDQWTVLPNILSPRCDISSVVYKNCFYVFGGFSSFDNQNPGSDVAATHHHYYNFKEKEWSVIDWDRNYRPTSYQTSLFVGKAK